MNKYLYTLSICIFVSVIISCDKKQDNLQGIWLSSYAIDINGNSKPFSSMRLIEFKNDSIYTVGLNSYPGSNIKSNYFINKNSLVISDSIKIGLDKISKDSLVFIDDFDYSKIIYFKLSDSLKNQSQKELSLVNKTYKLKSKYFEYTIKFVNDSILHKDTEDLPIEWKLVSYEGYNILLIDDIFIGLPLIIRNVENNQINLSTLYTYPESLRLIRDGNVGNGSN